AQEVEEVVPELVIGEEGKKGVKYEKIIALVTKAIQQQHKIVQENKDKIITLELKTNNILNTNDQETSFKGALVADSIKTTSIEGLNFASESELELVKQQINLQNQNISNLASQIISIQSSLTNQTLNLSIKSLEVLEGATFKANVEFQGPAVFKALV
ncbi:MAG: hypothetical protein N3A54_05890, partial [Patescibacteria group bacterium]|nr:hypothetical protein [Patescibacteria group bacterium]